MCDVIYFLSWREFKHSCSWICDLMETCWNLLKRSDLWPQTTENTVCGFKPEHVSSFWSICKVTEQDIEGIYRQKVYFSVLWLWAWTFESYFLWDFQSFQMLQATRGFSVLDPESFCILKIQRKADKNVTTHAMKLFKVALRLCVSYSHRCKNSTSAAPRVTFLKLLSL